MRLAITFMGLDLLTLDLSTETCYDEPGDCTTYPIGFTASHEIPDGSGLPYREGWDE